VKDIMVRRPATVQADDTMELCLRRGRELGVAQFPVLDGQALVGVISATEIFQLAAHCVAAPPGLRPVPTSSQPAPPASATRSPP